MLSHSTVLHLALLGACGIAPAKLVADVERGPTTAQLATPIAFGPVADPATSYNQPIAAASTPLRDGVHAALVELARDRGDPRRDARLDLASGDLAELLARGGVAVPAVVDLALQGRGVIEPIHKLLVAHGTTPDAVVAEIREALGESLFFGNARVGIGGGGEQPLVIIVVHASLVTLQPIPRALAAHGEAELAGTLDPQFHAPQVTVAYEDEREAITHPAIWKTDRWTFSTTVACGMHTGTAWVLVEAADDHYVVARLALFPIACAMPAIDSFRIEHREPVADPQIVRRLAAIVNRERAAAGLSILRGDLRTDEAAHREVLLMQRAHSVDHALGNTTTTVRLRDANLMPTQALEATLHAPDVASAAEILMNDRGYRAVLARPEVTHIGIAVAFDEHHELYVAIELVQIQPPIDTQRLAAAILARINAKRDKFQQLKLDKHLMQLATKYTELRARGWTDESVTRALQDSPNLVFSGFNSLKRALSLVLDDDPDKVDLGNPGNRVDGVAVSVVQSPRNGALTGRVWVIILYGHRID